nr:MAG TPA: hypothetical protein [Caudoviricetes sp.]DAX60387.1 MAG TPA: hypothetical protein [Caudoviricetes sp.]
MKRSQNGLRGFDSLASYRLSNTKKQTNRF